MKINKVFICIFMISILLFFCVAWTFGNVSKNNESLEYTQWYNTDEETTEIQTVVDINVPTFYSESYDEYFLQ